MGGGKAATSSGRAAGGGGYTNTRSLSFDKSDDHVTCGDVDNLDSASAFTVSCWVFLSTANSGSNQAIFSMGAGSSSTTRFWKGGSQEIRFQANNGSSLSTTSAHRITLDAWNHVAVTYASATAKIYINASLKKTGTTGTLGASGGTGFNIGRLFAGYNTHYWGGLIDEFAIWTATLDDDDITAIYNSGVPNDLSVASSYNTDRTGSLTNWYRMEEGSGTSVVNTANSETNDATLVNGPTFSTSVPS